MHGSFQCDVLSRGGSFSGRVGRQALSNDGRRKEATASEAERGFNWAALERGALERAAKRARVTEIEAVLPAPASSLVGGNG